MKQKEIQKAGDSIVAIKEVTSIVQTLMTLPHYKKIGPEGVFSIVSTAKAMNVDPLRALNGGFYYVQGKVEMSSVMMAELIWGAGHMISKDEKSDDTICILHGKRANNGAMWTESFSIEDAKKAGIYRNQWLKYPKDMLYARALSRLARQLFPDTIKGCYTQGEISSAIEAEKLEQVEHEEVKVQTITNREAEELQSLINEDDQFKERVKNFLERANIESINCLPRAAYNKILPQAIKIGGESLQKAS